MQDDQLGFFCVLVQGNQQREIQHYFRAVMLLKQPNKPANIYGQLKARKRCAKMKAVQEPCYLGQYFSTSLTS